MTTRRQAVQLSLLAAFLPSFLSEALASSADRASALFDAQRRAVERGRPLLVLIVPSDEATWYPRGQAFGALLNHGGDEALAAFALCEVVCGREADVAELAGQPVPAGAWYALLETDRVPAVVRFAIPGSPVQDVKPWASEDWMASNDAATEAGIRTHRDVVVGLVMPDRAALVRYVAQADATDPVSARLVRGTLDRPDPVTVSRAPAVLALAATDGGVDRRRAVSVLGDLGREEWVGQVVPGSRWAHAGGCGTTVEGVEEQVMRACGMGYVSAKASRMLYFFEEPR